MKYTFTLFFLYILSSSSVAQNRVMNPSFEVYNNCPNNCFSGGCFSGYQFIADWESATVGAPIYYNTCANSLPGADNGSKVPINTSGYQQPRTGNAYIGLGAIAGQYGNNASDSNIFYIFPLGAYPKGKLYPPLEKDSIYCFSFYVALSDSSDYATDAFSAYISNYYAPINSSSPYLPISYPPQINNPQFRFLSDTSGWMKISGTFKAKGGEDCITLGAIDASNAHLQKSYTSSVVNQLRLGFRTSFYLLDDVSVTPLLALNIGNDSLLCDTLSFNKTLTVPPIYDSVHWSTGATTNQITISTIGQYYVVCYDGDCEISDTITISYRQNLQAPSIPDSAICREYFPITIAAPNGFDRYSWSNGDTTSFTQIIHTGTYQLTTSYLCNSFSDTFVISQKTPPIPPLLKDTAFCIYSSIDTLSAVGLNIRWYNTLIDTINLSLPPAPSKDSLYTITYFATQTIDGCESDRAPIVVNINPLPYANIGDNQKHCKGISLKLETNTDSSFRYLWNTGDTLPFIVVNASNSYWCDVTNICGTVRDETTIEFVSCNECLYAPNAFSPNGDGRNDVYTVFSNCPLKYFQLQIFNRWGEKVFATSDAHQPWDGSYKDSPLSAGVYVYQLILVNELGETTSTKGSITLIR